MILGPIKPPRDELQSLIVRLGVTAAVVLLLALSAVAVSALWGFDRDIQPELLRKVDTLGDALEGDLQRVVDARIPLAELLGLSAFFDDAVRDNDELSYVALTDARGRLIAASSGLAHALGHGSSGVGVGGGGSAALPHDAMPVSERLRAVDRITAEVDTFIPVGHYLDLGSLIKARDGTVMAILHLGVPDTLVARRLKDIIADVGVSLFVAIVITLEVLSVLMALLVRRPLAQLRWVFSQRVVNGNGTGAPRHELDRLVAAAEGLIRHIQERAARVSLEGGGSFASSSVAVERPTLRRPEWVHIRLPLFVYLLGVELVRSYLVIYITQFYEPMPGLSREVVISLPAISWCLAVFLATPLAVALGRRFSARTLFVIGCIPTIIASVLMAVAQDMTDLILLRALIGLGTGTVTFSAIVYITENAPEGELARGMATYVGASMAGGLGGTAFGAILADRIGFRPTFDVIAVVVALSALVAWFMLPADKLIHVDKAKAKVTWRQMASVVFDRQVLSLSLLSTLPTRIILYGAFTFLLPLLLTGMGIGQSTIGQIMMCYFVAMVVLSPVISAQADRFNCHLQLLIAGGIVSGLAAMMVGNGGDGWEVLAGVILIGIGQAMVTTTQFSVIPSLMAKQCARFGQASVTSTVRTMERFAALIGPTLMSVASGIYGFGGAIWWLGVGTLAATGMLWLMQPPRRAALKAGTA